MIGRKHFAIFFSLLFFLASTASAENQLQAGPSPDEALEKLMEGNHRYVARGLTLQERSNQATRTKLVEGQHPRAIVLACSDSRVSPEILFDQGLGEIFVVRVAGNVADDFVMGSIEYGVEHLGVPLVMVLGHSQCGAVTSAFDQKEELHGYLGRLINAIKPAVEKAWQINPNGDRATVLNAAIDENINLVADSLKRSEILKKMEEEGAFKIVKGRYDLACGHVSITK